MEAYRKGIDENPETLAKLVRRFNRQTHFVLAGPEYARSKGGGQRTAAALVSEEVGEFAARAAAGRADILPELAQDMIEGFEALMPFYKYFDRLCAAQAEK